MYHAVVMSYGAAYPSQILGLNQNYYTLVIVKQLLV